MKQGTVITVSVLGIVGVLMLGILAGQVGGVSIRTSAVQAISLSLGVSEPIVVGVPVTVRWEIEQLDPATQLVFLIRDATEEHAVGQAILGDGATSITVPCALGGAQRSLLVRVIETNEVVSQQQVQLLAAGPDCVAR